MSVQNKCLLMVSLFFVCALLFVAGCGRRSLSSPQGYRLDKPERFGLGKALNEISGISYSHKEQGLYAISDSKEKIFFMDLEKMKLKDFTEKVVPPDSDLEDIVKFDSATFVLLSKGVLKEIPDSVKDSAGVQTYELGLGGNNDFETIYYDPTANGLILLCKKCAHEKGEGFRTAFRFNLATKTFDPKPFYTIAEKELFTLLPNTDVKFEPSAAAIHPLNKRLYILSSAGNLLVIADTRGKIIEAYHLNPDDFPQAEGIAFAPNGDMYISNEGKYGMPTLLHFVYRETEKKK